MPNLKKNATRQDTVRKFATSVTFVRGNLHSKFGDKRTTFDKVIVTILKNTDGPKFADPSMAAVSPYFKGSMGAADIKEIWTRLRY